MPQQQTQLRVLLVEDHDATAAVVCKLLKINGYDACCVTSFQQALVHAGKQQFDLLISDIELPDGSGTALLQEIRKLYPVKAIAVTGHANSHHREQFITAGFDRYIPRPFSWHRLASMIEELRIDANTLSGSEPDMSSFGK